MPTLTESVQVGDHYTVMVSGTLSVVRILSENPHGGWDGLNTDTGRKVRIKTVQRLRRKVEPQAAADFKPAEPVQQSLIETAPVKPSPVVPNSVEAPVGGLAARLSATNRETEAPHLIIVARAGTGKTTTGISALQVLFGNSIKLTPSDQQQAIFEAFALSPASSRIAMVAFNKSIATELQQRVPSNVEAMTMHSMGFRAVKKAFRLAKGRDMVNGWKTRNTVESLLGMDRKDIHLDIMVPVDKLVGLAKSNLIGSYDKSSKTYSIDYHDLDRLCSKFDIEIHEGTEHISSRYEVYDLVQQVLERHANVQPGDSVDFNDMIWLPVVLDLPIVRYDVLFVDEAQDLNPCQQALALKAGKRLIFCGDDKQAIYGFTGADSESLNTLRQRLSDSSRGCTVLPLTKTFRCGKKIVAEAQAYVPDFEAADQNGPGSVREVPFDSETNDWRALVSPGDMILSRVNAPLVSECMRFLKNGRRAKIQGRDIGKQLGTLIKKLVGNKNGGCVSSTELITLIEAWREKEVAAENKKKNPEESRIIAISDRADCVSVFAEACSNSVETLARIEEIFTDEGQKDAFILLSSIHKAKGLEARRVFFLRHKHAPCPHPMAKQAWAREQEDNLCYVAITRAIEELVYVC